jgi:hypothetical protein
MNENRRLGNRGYHELSFVANGSNFHVDPVDRVGRPAPIVLDAKCLVDAVKIIIGIARHFHSHSFDSNNRNQFYLLDGGVVEVHERDAYPGYVKYLGVLHEGKEGLAYIVNKLHLPQDGERLAGW